MFEYDVFICYSSKDKPIIETLIEDLKKEQITYWIDAEQIKFGDIIIDKINDGLKKSKFVIPCLSKNLITSGWTSSEYGAVLNAELSGNSKRTVIPLKLDDCEDDDIPPLLRVKKRVVYSDKIELKELIKFLKKHQSEQKDVEDILKQEMEEQERLKRQREEVIWEAEISKKIDELEKVIWISPVLKEKILEEARISNEEPKDLTGLKEEVEKKKIEANERKTSKSIEISKTFSSPSAGMQFVLIPSGKFIMGSPSGEQGRFPDEGPTHEVTIKNSFYMSKYPVTQKQWVKVVKYNPSYFKGEDHPVENVSWDDAQKFIAKMNEIESTSKYRLPSESEWEYACRAGTRTRYSFGDDESKLVDYAWYSGYTTYEEWEENNVKILIEGKTHPVGQKKPNPWGLYDVYGNVWDWCQDKYHNDYNGAPNDGNAWKDGNSTENVCRGGSWDVFSQYCRSASRGMYVHDKGDMILGFRVVREI